MNYKKLLISLLLPQLTGLIGSLFTVSAISTWYLTLNKPVFSPPNWVFGPAWVLLYVLMGISIYLVWNSPEEIPEKRTDYKKVSLWFFWLHLFFNGIWSILFFGLKNPAWAFVDIIIIWSMIILLMLRFWKINKRATYLLIPYLLWVSFASCLNYFIWFLN